MNTESQPQRSELAAEQGQLHQLSIYLEGNPYSDPDFMADSRALKAAIKLKEQLLHALASIEKAKETIHALHGDVAWEIYDKHSPEMKMINAVDLSALHQHDAEVREDAFSEGWLRACVLYVDIDAEMPDNDCSKELKLRLDALAKVHKKPAPVSG